MEAKEYYEKNNRFKESIASLYEEDILELMENYAAHVLSIYIEEEYETKDSFGK